jgi:hypothetical protein
MPYSDGSRSSTRRSSSSQSTLELRALSRRIASSFSSRTGEGATPGDLRTMIQLISLNIWTDATGVYIYVLTLSLQALPASGNFLGSPSVTFTVTIPTAWYGSGYTAQSRLSTMMSGGMSTRPEWTNPFINAVLQIRHRLYYTHPQPWLFDNEDQSRDVPITRWLMDLIDGYVADYWRRRRQGA